MSNEKPLYQDPDISIEPMLSSPEDFIFYFRDSKEECPHYIIPKGCLRDIATTPKDKLEAKIMDVNYLMVKHAHERGIDIVSLGLAIAQAYIEERKRYENYATSIRDSQDKP